MNLRALDDDPTEYKESMAAQLGRSQLIQATFKRDSKCMNKEFGCRVKRLGNKEEWECLGGKVFLTSEINKVIAIIE